jgi:hypothetical protein
MDTHRNIAAWLAIGTGAFGLVAITAWSLFAAGVAALIGVTLPVWGFLAAFGLLIGAVLAGFALVDVVAGIFYLRERSPVARFWLLFSSAFALLRFPLGTAVGAYTLWALLRDSPEDVAALRSARVVDMAP